jgi:uncharacterized protein (DUF2141 family)
MANVKQLLFAVLFLPISSMSYSNKPTPEEQYSIIVNIQNIRCCEGVIMLGLYNEEDKWLDSTGMVRGRLSIANSDKQTIELHGLPAGEYAIAIIQDLNQNQKLDRKLGILPKEPYGFSNNTGRYGPGKYKNAKFTLDQDMVVTISLIDRNKKEGNQ